jgi:hypothetical protein
MAAVNHFAARRSCATAAAFAPIDNEPLVGRRVVEVARGVRGS